MLRFVLLFTCLCLLGACMSPAKIPAGVEFSTVVESPARMRFRGKGAGAGMMLMSSMGPAGIAVGIAIDEGIGKDIEKTAKAANFDIEVLVRNAFIDAVEKNAQFKNISEITISRYGFVTRPGDNDPIAAQQHLKVLFEDGDQLLVQYPEEFSDEQIDTALLGRVKVDGDLIVRMHQVAAKKTAAKAAQIR